MIDDVLFMLSSLRLFEAKLASANRLYQSQRRKLSIEARWQFAEAGAVIGICRCFGFLHVAPALVGALRHRDDRFELARADDVDPAVAAVVEAEDPLAGNQAVLDDPVQGAADQFVR